MALAKVFDRCNQLPGWRTDGHGRTVCHGCAGWKNIRWRRGARSRRNGFKVAAKRLRPLGDVASESDLLWFAFDGEALRIAGCGTAVILPATGNAWDLRYAIKGRKLNHLPRRLADPVVIGVWDGRLLDREACLDFGPVRTIGPTFIDIGRRAGRDPRKKRDGYNRTRARSRPL